MRSFPRFSLVLSIFLLSCSPSQAQHAHRQEGPRTRHRRTDKLNGAYDAKYKRDTDAAFTWFVDGQGACGAVNGPNDFIVALNSAQFDQGHCFEMITVTIGGKSAVAQITDECRGCSSGGLDLSQGLFQYFAPLSEGELHGSWIFNSDVATSSSTSAPTTTSYTPSSTTTSWTSLSTTISTASASTVPSPTSTKSTVPTSTPQDPEMLAQINLALLELGVLLQASLKLEN